MPAVSLLLIMQVLDILCGLLSHRYSKKILSIAFKMHDSGLGKTESLYISCEANSELIIVTLPYKDNFLCAHILMRFLILVIGAVRFISTILLKSVEIVIPSTVTSLFVHFKFCAVFKVNSVPLNEPILSISVAHSSQQAQISLKMFVKVTLFH